MPLALNNCPITNNTAVTIRVVPDAPGHAFDVPPGQTVNSGVIVFDTIPVPGDVLDTDADQAANQRSCYFVLVDGEYRFNIPDDFSAVFS
ncbi:hypothetical protein VA599_01385 [Chromobacterium sp. TRC.1.1.SA]|uniref:Uncharacterized protein n=1 Tax=Chromobacterium indicum TaxID=3110228 RepID=A0ABV0CEU5_9NEIS